MEILPTESSICVDLYRYSELNTAPCPWLGFGVSKRVSAFDLVFVCYACSYSDRTKYEVFFVFFYSNITTNSPSCVSM